MTETQDSDQLLLRLVDEVQRLAVPGASSLGDYYLGDDETFLRQAYFYLLGRAPDQDGLRHFLAALQQGSHSRLSVLRELVESPEGRDRQAQFPLLEAEPVWLNVLARFAGQDAGGWFEKLLARHARSFDRLNAQVQQRNQAQAEVLRSMVQHLVAAQQAAQAQADGLRAAEARAQAELRVVEQRAAEDREAAQQAAQAQADGLRAAEARAQAELRVVEQRAAEDREAALRLRQDVLLLRQDLNLHRHVLRQFMHVRRIFVDCSNTYNTQAHTGIQRVVRKIIQNGAQVATIAPGFQVQPVILNESSAFCELRELSAHRYEAAHSAARPSAPEPAVYDEARFASGDILVLLDSSWHLDIWPAVDAARRGGVKVILVSYDLIPLTHPQYCDDDLIAIFTAFTERALSSVDGIIAISRTVRDQVQDYYRKHVPQPAATPPRFEYFHLGADLLPSARQGVPGGERQHISAFFSQPEQPVYLMACTIEPRKNHAYVLDAFERLWAQGSAARLCLIGKVGWKVEELMARIQNHPEFNRRLVVWNDISDTELDYCYRHARALIFPSVTEGFGLPIIESLQRGLPVIASDIAVHREAGGDVAMYVDIDDPDALFELVTRMEATGIPAQHRPSAEYHWLTWAESANMFFRKVLDMAGAEQA